VALNLAATLAQTGLLLESRSASSRTATADNALPSKFTDAVLAKIADRVVAPYNKKDMDALYAEFDEIARNEIPHDKFEAEFSKLSNLVGKVESSSYVGSQKLQSQAGRLDMYQLNFVVRLSGGNFPTGTMTINVVDRESGPGIVGVFINGKSQT
jgi:hypothetical protein